MRKKKLIEQNLSLFERLQKSQREVSELKNQLDKSKEEITKLKAQLEKNKNVEPVSVATEPKPIITESKSVINEPKPVINEPKPVVTEPMRRLEEKVIVAASVKPDTEYGATVIGKIVVAAAEYSNKLTIGGDDSKKELINLILGKTEVSKAEILSVVEGDDSFEVKCAKIDQIAAVSKEYFESVVAQI